MYSSEHFLAGAIVSGLATLALWGRRSAARLAALAGYGVALSVFIDLDHFLITRLRTGDWSHLRAAASDPRWAFTDQDEVFEDEDDERLRLQRLLSHLLLGGALSAAWYALVGPLVAAYSAAVVYVHVVCDLLRDADLA